MQEGFCLVLAELWLVADASPSRGSFRFLCVLCVFLCVCSCLPLVWTASLESVYREHPHKAWAEAGHLPLRASSLTRFSDGVSHHSCPGRFTEQAWESGWPPGPGPVQAEICCIPAFIPSQNGLAEGSVHCFWPMLYGRDWANQGVASVCEHSPIPPVYDGLPSRQPITYAYARRTAWPRSLNPFGSLTLEGGHQVPSLLQGLLHCCVRSPVIPAPSR